MARFRFKAADVEKLVEHVRQCEAHLPTFGQMLEPQYHKPGNEVAEGDFPRAEDIDLTKVPAGLHLVKDRGVYLMSNGSPRLPGDAEYNFVAYAEGYNPSVDAFDEWYDNARVYLGGDDFVEHIDVDWWDQFKSLGGGEHFDLDITEEKIALMVPAPTKGRRSQP